MSITYQCERCGRWYTVRGGKVGTRARCEDCGHEMTVPDTPDLLDDAVDGPRGGAAPMVGRGPMTKPSPSSAARPGSASPPAGDDSSGKLWGGGLGIAGFILILVLKVALRGPAFGGRPRPARRPPQAVQVVAEPVDLDGPIRLPARFPDLGPPREVEPGILFHEVVLPAVRPAAPGHSGRLWLYLPAAPGGGRPAAGSLPCVLIAPAGGRGLTGMQLANGDHPEHLPYVRAGFAVLSFELDGADPFPNRPGLPARPIMEAFLRARAGLVNGEVARAFLKEKVPEVDPGRLYVAGHSSAGTFALLFAEHTPYARGCVAYAPVVDLGARFDAARLDSLRRLGLGALVTRYSPRASESTLGCPVYLFQARDDEVVPAGATEAFADRLRAMGKPVTLDLVDGGDGDVHYESMIRDGIPRGVAWLKARDAEVRAGRK